jgi:hypothetical protein
MIGSHENTKARRCRANGEAVLNRAGSGKREVNGPERLRRKNRRLRAFVSSCEKILLRDAGHWRWRLANANGAACPKAP